MKIRKSLPLVGDQFNFDAPIYSILKPTKQAFLFLSAFTVFLGVRSQISDNLPSNTILTALVLIVAFVLFSFTPDLLNSKLTSFISAIVLELRFKILDVVLLIFSIALIVALSFYSFKMSKNSANAAHNQYKLKPELINTKSITTDLDTRLTRTNENHQAEQAEIKARYATLTTTTNIKYQNSIEPYNAEIKRLEALRTAENTKYITKKQNAQRKRISREQAKQATEIQTTQTAEQNELKESRTRRDKLEQEHTTRNKSELTKAKAANDKETAKADKLNKITNTLFTNLAGYAIFIVIVLTILQKVIEHRNDIKPVAEISQTDFQLKPLTDLMRFPAVILGRYTLNFIYRLYNALPELQKVKKTTEIINYHEKQKIIPLNAPRRNGNGYKVITAQADGTTTETDNADFDERRRIGFEGVTHKKGVFNTQGETDTNLLYLQSRLKQYRKRLSVSERKKRTAEKQGKQANGNTLKSIQNNAQWVQHSAGLIEPIKS
jgi:hypothetical protein